MSSSLLWGEPLPGGWLHGRPSGLPSRAGLAERNAHFDCRAGFCHTRVADGCYLEGAARVGRALMHGEQAEATEFRTSRSERGEEADGS